MNSYIILNFLKRAQFKDKLSLPKHVSVNRQGHDRIRTCKYFVQLVRNETNFPLLTCPGGGIP
jgi:hypothetical protein